MENVSYILKNEMKIPENDKKRIRELNNLFIMENMPYLNGKTLPQKIKTWIIYMIMKLKNNLLTWRVKTMRKIAFILKNGLSESVSINSNPFSFRNFEYVYFKSGQRATVYEIDENIKWKYIK